jgi:glycosyltransferase involved in cell wall biosynthesis
VEARVTAYVEQGERGEQGERDGRDVFFVSNSVNELGGVTSWSHQMARLLTGRGHRVHVVGITPAEVVQEIGDAPHLPHPPYPMTTLYAGQPPRPGRAREASMREQAAKLTALFRAARPGGVVIVTQVWAMEWVAQADTSGLTVIGMSHESYEYSRASSRFHRVRKHYKDVDRMLALTREDADLWIGQGLNNASFMPNPLPFMPEVPSPRTEKVVVSIGRLHDQKGIDMLHDTWAEVAPRRPDWTLRI